MNATSFSFEARLNWPKPMLELCARVGASLRTLRTSSALPVRFESVVALCPNLASIVLPRLTRSSSFFNFRAFSHLRELRLCAADEAMHSTAMLHSIPERIEVLTGFRLGRKFSSTQIDTFLRSHALLRELQLCSYSRTRDPLPIFRLLSEHCGGISSVAIVDCAISAEGLLLLRAIRKFELRFNRQVPVLLNEKEFIRFCDRNKGLEVLSLARCTSELSSRAFASVRRLRCLKEFSIGDAFGCEQDRRFDHACVLAMLPPCSSIRRLTFSELGELTDECIEHIANSCRKLRALTVRCCYKVGTNALRRLIEQNAKRRLHVRIRSIRVDSVNAFDQLPRSVTFDVIR